MLVTTLVVGKSKTFEMMVFFLALGLLLWIALAIWHLVRQATASKLSIKYFAAILAIQIIFVALPFVIRDWSVAAAGLSEFAGCPNGQEYCDEFYQLERIRGRMLFDLGVAFWAGVVVWLLTIFRRAEIHVERGAR